MQQFAHLKKSIYIYTRFSLTKVTDTPPPLSTHADINDVLLVNFVFFFFFFNNYYYYYYYFGSAFSNAKADVSGLNFGNIS